MSSIVEFSSEGLLSELGISVEELYSQEALTSADSKRLVTYKTAVPESRKVTSSWMELESNSGGHFSWNIPNSKEFVEELDDVKGKVVKLRGVIVRAEMQPSLQYYISSESRYVTKCTLVGYKDSLTGQLVKGLPGTAPLKTLYEYDKYLTLEVKGKTIKGGYNKNRPTKLVEELGLVGSQGLTCANCIRSGCNTLENDKGETIYCDVTTNQMFFYLTDFTTKKIIPSKDGSAPTISYTDYKVKDVLDEEGILLQFSLPNKLALKGNYDAKEKKFISTGYVNYIDSLKYQFKGKTDPRKMPYYNYTELSIVNIPGVVKNFLDFKVIVVQDHKQYATLINNSRACWDKVNPQKEMMVLDPMDFESDSTHVVSHQETQLPKMKVVSQQLEVDELEEVESPF